MAGETFDKGINVTNGGSNGLPSKVALKYPDGSIDNVDVVYQGNNINALLEQNGISITPNGISIGGNNITAEDGTDNKLITFKPNETVGQVSMVVSDRGGKEGGPNFHRQETIYTIQNGMIINEERWMTAKYNPLCNTRLINA